MNQLKKFRKKPVVIEAIQYTGKNIREVVIFLNVSQIENDFVGNWIEWIDIKNPEVAMRAMPGDWIIRGVKGEMYPCKHDIFKLTYEEWNDQRDNGHSN